MGGGGGSQTSETRTDVPEWMRPYSIDILERAKELSTTPLGYYPGETVAGFTPEQIKAQELIAQRALAGSPLVRTAQGGIQETMEGKYLTPESNPYLSAYVQRGFEETLPQMDTSAIQAGRYGSGAWGEMRGRAMADIASNIYGAAYEAERGRQMEAYRLAPELSLMDYADLEKLAGVGSQKQELEQKKIDEAIKKWEFEQMEPWQRLYLYGGFLPSDFGGVSTTQIRGGGK